MRFLVMGAGAIGSVFGGLLARAGHQVTLVGRDPHMTAVARHGLRTSGIWGEHHVTGLEAVTSPPRDGGPYDAVLLTTKAYDTVAALRAAAPALAGGPDVVSLQNGLGNLEAVAEAAGPERTLGGRVIFGAEVVEPGHVVVTVCADDVAVGSPGNRAPADRAARLAAAFAEAGIPASVTDRIESLLWAKLLYNASLNGLSAVLGVPYGALLEQEETRSIMGRLVAEAFAAARAEGVALPWESPEAYRRTLFEELIPATAAHRSSMLQDIARGRRTEIDAINGAVVRVAERHGLDAPANRLVTELVRARERLARGARHG
ncbi:MAG TPA: ketopantoate reductase family protein [Dehalococcoidia bacterium]